MIDALHISETGLKATQVWLDYLSNNVANMHTPGYKKANVNFQDMVAAPAMADGGQRQTSSADQMKGLGARISSPVIDLSAGAFNATSRPLDVAIKGRGLLEVVMPNGSFAYTRLGNLEVNKEGFLAVRGGHMLSDRIHVPEDLEKLEIRPDGSIIGTHANTGIFSEIELGRIQLAEVVDSSALRPMGNSLFQLEGEAEVMLRQPGENGSGELVQGFLEMSNVDLVSEMTNLVLAQRAYQLNARLIQTADQILETINNLRR